MIDQVKLLGFIRQFIIPHEGIVFENDPDDDGNKGDGSPGNYGTKFGIDARSHPGVDIVNLTQEQAELIYQNEFFTSLSGSLPWPLAPVFFDIHVNNGETRAIKILQKALGVAQDGLVGPVTHGMIQSCNAVALACILPKFRDSFYEDLAEAVPKDRKYLRGWEVRDADLLDWVKNNLS